MLDRPFADPISCALVLLALGGCSSAPPLCIRTARWQDGAAHTVMTGARLPLAAGLLDMLDECDRPVPTTVAWSSSIPSVARVDSSGVVHALSPGTADVVARSAGAEARYRVTVVPRVTRIEITPAETTLTAGDTASFRAIAYGIDRTPLPAVTLIMRATEARASYRQHGGVPALGEAMPYRTKGHTPTPGVNEFGVFGRRRAWGHVVASLVGRADSVVVRVVERPGSRR